MSTLRLKKKDKPNQMSDLKPYLRILTIEPHGHFTSEDTLISVEIQKPGCSKCTHGQEQVGAGFVVNQQELRRVIKHLQGLLR